jgi:hypothetical protein
MENRMAPKECLGNNMQAQTVLYVKGNRFKRLLKKLCVTLRTEFMWFRIGRTNSIIPQFPGYSFLKSCALYSQLMKPFNFSAHMKQPWYLDTSSCFSKGQWWHALSFFDSRMKQKGAK